MALVTYTASAVVEEARPASSDVEAGLLTTSGVDRWRISQARVESSLLSDERRSRSFTVGRRGGDELCMTIDFEGIDDLDPVGVVPGFPTTTTFGSSWLGIVDEDAGGSGNFANEPSPSTSAFFLEPVEPIDFEPGVYSVEIYYSAAATSLPITLTAWDGPGGMGSILATAVGNTIGTNYDGAACTGDPTGNFCLWDTLAVTASKSPIRSITFSTPVPNYIGFDNLLVCVCPNDCDCDGIPNEIECPGEGCNDNGIPDCCEPDCNMNGIPDDCDIMNGTSKDLGGGASTCCIAHPDPGCDDPGIEACVCAIDPFCCEVTWDKGCVAHVDDFGCGCCSCSACIPDGVPDECGDDCNGNGIDDGCDIKNGTSPDCNGNFISDECEPECNGNGIPDDCDIDDCPQNDPTCKDCQPDDIPDGCQFLNNDCNANLVPDECDIAKGTSKDCDGNGVPDECETDSDSDGVIDDCDNCPVHSNADQFDGDLDGIGDACEACPGDANGDGVVDPLDSGRVLSNLGCLVGTGDGLCDGADVNGDGLVDPLDDGFVKSRFGQSCVVIGACCVDAALGLCESHTAEDCQTTGGVYAGDATGCDNLCCLPEPDVCPPNDLCEIPLAISCKNKIPVVDNTNATTQPLDPESACMDRVQGQGFHSLWYEFTSATTSVFVVATGLGDARLSLLQGDCSSLVEIACAETTGGGGKPHEPPTLCAGGLVPGETYLIEFVTASQFTVGEVLLNLSCVGDCAVTGACCFTDGSCLDPTEDECNAQGGTYLGDGTTCEANSCDSLTDCCVVHSDPGCDNICGVPDETVEDCVCPLDPFCCEVEWDAACVAHVEDFGCGDCPNCPSECPNCTI